MGGGRGCLEINLGALPKNIWQIIFMVITELVAIAVG